MNGYDHAGNIKENWGKLTDDDCGATLALPPELAIKTSKISSLGDGYIKPSYRRFSR
jgi:hypothetical protein